MSLDWSRRKTLQIAGSTLGVALSGCSALASPSYPTGDSTLGGTDYDPIVAEQPTIDEGVPVVWGMLVSHPDVSRKLIDWGGLTADGGGEPGVEFRTFDPDEQFMSVVVGVLPTGYALKGYTDEDATFLDDLIAEVTNRHPYDDGVLRYEVTTYRAFSPEPRDPDYHYDYTFSLWNLNGNDRPDEIEVHLHTE